jgi:hypothetical protein
MVLRLYLDHLEYEINNNNNNNMEIMGSGDCSLPSLTDIGAATTGSSWACI